MIVQVLLLAMPVIMDILFQVEYVQLALQTVNNVLVRVIAITVKMGIILTITHALLVGKNASIA